MFPTVSLVRTTLCAVLLCLGAAACTTRPFQPPPAAYTLWTQPGVSELGVRRAMVDCGFPDPANITPREMSTNDAAQAQLCMLEIGFRYQGRRILCTDSPELPACANVPRGRTFGTDPDFDPAVHSTRAALPPPYTFWQRANTDADGVKQAMRACGFASVTLPGVGLMKADEVAAAELCMLDRHFTYTWPANALMCKSSPALPSCRGRKIDTQNCCAAPRAAGQR